MSIRELKGADIAWFGVLFGKTISSALTTAFSVFAALLFNVLVLIYDIVRKSNGTQSVSSLKTRFLRQIYSNVAYSVLVSITLIALLLLYYLALSLGNKWLPLTYFAAFCVYALAANFILTTLMVLKRLHFLLSTEFEVPSEKPSIEARRSA